jgi:hypothetical protein
MMTGPHLSRTAMPLDCTPHVTLQGPDVITGGNFVGLLFPRSYLTFSRWMRLCDTGKGASSLNWQELSNVHPTYWE